MSSSSTHKTFVAAVFCAALLILSGCGDSGNDAAGPGGQAPDDLAGSLSPTDAAPRPSEVRPADEPENDDRAGGPTEETDFAPVDVELKDGKFARGTPKTIHVPSGFIVVVGAQADDHGRYRLSVQSPSVAQTFIVAPGELKKITLDSLREGQQAKLMLGRQTLRIAADAEPGP